MFTWTAQGCPRVGYKGDDLICFCARSTAIVGNTWPGHVLGSAS